MNNLDSSPSAFRDLHRRGRILILPNAWDAGSARLIEDCGARAIATTSAGLAWAHGYPDENVLPVRVLVGAVSEIARVIRVPLTVDIEAGYSDEPRAVGDLVHAVMMEGALGINIEDGTEPPPLLCAKIEAARTAAARAGVDLFVNARVDVFLRGLVARERAIDATIERILLYRASGCDGAFVPGLAEPADIRAIVEATSSVPLNVMVVPGLPPAAELERLGVQRLSAGTALASAGLGLLRRLATDFIHDGGAQRAPVESVEYTAMNALFRSRRLDLADRG